MQFNEYLQHDAMALAALAEKGEISEQDLLDLAIARAEAVNAQLNALIHPLYDMARAQINAGLSGPLAGVPSWSRISVRAPSHGQTGAEGPQRQGSL
ncbi:MAG: hypothetical protein P1U67_10150 [Alcanivoracaceae bacterium]|nr:hypothetical protein [Alcanivoracaceae bacterium]